MTRRRRGARRRAPTPSSEPAGRDRQADPIGPTRRALLRLGAAGGALSRQVSAVAGLAEPERAAIPRGSSGNPATPPGGRRRLFRRPQPRPDRHGGSSRTSRGPGRRAGGRSSSSRPLSSATCSGSLPCRAIARGLRRARSSRGSADRATAAWPSTAIDAGVVTADGVIEYDYLALASGIRLAARGGPGTRRAAGREPVPLRGAPALVDLRQRIAALPGRPRGHRHAERPLQVPAGALRVRAAVGRPHHAAAAQGAGHPRRSALAAGAAALAGGLMDAMEAHASVLTYEPFTQVRSVDSDGRAVETEAGRLSFDILSVHSARTRRCRS